MSRQLPPRPDLDQLRHQARDLQKSARAGRPDALAAVSSVSSRLTLSAAQTALAREYGFASWPRLKAFVDDVALRPVAAASTGVPARARLFEMDDAIFEAASQPGRRLVGRLGLTDEEGWPRCATVRPPLIEWTVE